MFDIELELKGNKVAEKGDLKGTGGKDVNGDIKFTNENSIHHRPTSLNGSVNEGYMSERLWIVGNINQQTVTTSGVTSVKILMDISGTQPICILLQLISGPVHEILEHIA